MRARTLLFTIPALIPLASTPAQGQTFPTDDMVLERIWEEGIERSMTHVLAQALMDSIGPRLAGSPEFDAAGAWLLAMYESWDVPARKEEYGTWRGWRQGALHVDMVAPRTQTLEADLLAYSPGSDGPVEGEVVVPPAGLTEESASQWLETVAGKYVLTSQPEPMCRARQELEQYARPETVARVDSLRQALRQEMSGRMRGIARSRRDGERALEDAGA
ncbi:MAG: peptidase M28, partial [Gemmatimonadetes bacterium]|nr:peptidase M28 [Gemmatimonadota bacterium]